jgi:Raf kinase inhibitor-like YbhB/YbcL family protein
MSESKFQLLSPVFQDGANIPVQYTCKGQNINPPLSILNSPAGTLGYALIMHDPDAVNGDFLHWMMWDIPASTDSILPSSVPVGAIQGKNGSGSPGYTGPCPPKGTGNHRYIFEFFAVNKATGLTQSATEQDLRDALKDKTIAETRLTGMFPAEA